VDSDELVGKGLGAVVDGDGAAVPGEVVVQAAAHHRQADHADLGGRGVVTVDHYRATSTGQEALWTALPTTLPSTAPASLDLPLLPMTMRSAPT
jgi:hypothetical protein